MVAKISIGSSLYGVLAYNAQKRNIGKGKLTETANHVLSIYYKFNYCCPVKLKLHRNPCGIAFK